MGMRLSSANTPRLEDVQHVLGPRQVNIAKGEERQRELEDILSLSIKLVAGKHPLRHALEKNIFNCIGQLHATILTTKGGYIFIRTPSQKA